MHFEDAEIDPNSTPNGKSKVLGVIVLTDNRMTPSSFKRNAHNFRESAFKCIPSSIIETEIDPLDLANDPSTFIQDENAIVELSRRVAFLEARVEALSKNDVLS